MRAAPFPWRRLRLRPMVFLAAGVAGMGAIGGAGWFLAGTGSKGEAGLDAASEHRRSRPLGAGAPQAVVLGPELERVMASSVGEVAGLDRLEGLSDAELAHMVEVDLDSLGSMSVGAPNFGALVNGVQLLSSDLWETVEPDNAWGTQETIDGLVRAAETVHRELPGGGKLYIGHISRRGGGYLKPHRSHQSGRDADVAYYYLDGQKWYKRATAENLDRARTWLFVRTLIDAGVEYIFMDRSVQQLLREYAETLGEDPAWLDEVFARRGVRRQGIIRHVWGHLTHLHVRFQSPGSLEAGRRARPALVEQGHISPRFGQTVSRRR